MYLRITNCIFSHHHFGPSVKNTLGEILKYLQCLITMWMSPWHLNAHTLHPGYDGPSVDASPQLEPLVRPVGDNKLVDVGLISDHQHYFIIV